MARFIEGFHIAAEGIGLAYMPRMGSASRWLDAFSVAACGLLLVVLAGYALAVLSVLFG